MRMKKRVTRADLEHLTQVILPGGVCYVEDGLTGNTCLTNFYNSRLGPEPEHTEPKARSRRMLKGLHGRTWIHHYEVHDMMAKIKMPNPFRNLN